MPAADRAALFNQADAIIEKDFWVCWTLKRLFGIQGEDSPGLVFKGGTSLSKGYDAIRRFSEDIDLSFDRADLGYGGDRDPEAALSRKKADKLIHDLVVAVAKHIETVVLPRLSAAIERELGPATEAGWSLKIDPGEPQNLIFEYPVSLPEKDYSGFAYMSSRVKLEFGARGDPWPTEKREIVGVSGLLRSTGLFGRRSGTTPNLLGEGDGASRRTSPRPRIRNAAILLPALLRPCDAG